MTELDILAELQALDEYIDDEATAFLSTPSNPCTGP